MTTDPTTDDDKKEFTDDEKEAEGVKQILAALTDDEKKSLADPNMPLRHLRAEKGNIEKAIQKIKETIQWRKDFQVENLKTCFLTNNNPMKPIITLENSTGKTYVRNYDKQGRAILYMRGCNENTYDELNNMRHLVYNMERAIACTTRKTHGTKEKFNIAIDLIHFSMSKSPSMSASKHTLKIVQNYYPERLNKAYLLNVPFVFRAFYGLVKPFIDPVTKEKIVFVVGKGGVEKVGEDVDLEMVEECMGGSGVGLRDFDSMEYLTSSFDTTFDEK